MRYEIYNNWKVDKFSEPKIISTKKCYSSECLICNKIFTPHYGDVKSGKSKMCKECSSSVRFFKHGESPSLNKKSSILYSRWLNMKQRCYNKNNSHYNSYGRIGVTVCSEWINDFIAFRDWSLNNGFEPEKQIDKDFLSNKLGIKPSIYSPLTCMFVTNKENSSFKIANELTSKIGVLKRIIILREYDDENLLKAKKLISIGISYDDIKKITTIKHDATLSKIKNNEYKTLFEIYQEIEELEEKLYQEIV